MAEIRRKSVKNYPRINNCRVHPNCYIVLNRIAGEHSLGWAIEQICDQLSLTDNTLPIG